MVFDDAREENLKEKLTEERKEKAAYAKKVGQLTMQVDWLEKNLRRCLDLTTRVNSVRILHSTTEKPEIPVSIAANLCGINRSNIYYSGKPVSGTELECKEIIDHLYTDHPT